MAPPEQQRYVIVTGANTGLGLETTRGLMEAGCHVVMACRNMQLCLAAKQELEGRGQLPGSCECSRLDVSSRSSIQAFAHEQAAKLQARRQSLGVLVNNAGIMGSASSLSSSSDASDSVAPGVSDPHLVVNHLGPFLLTNLLLPHMAAGSRVVNVASRAHYAGQLQLQDGNPVLPDAPSNWFAQYARSKLCNVLHASELQSREASRGIIATSVSPGFVNSTIFRSLPSLLQWPAQRLASLVARTPAQGAEVAVFAATSPSLSAAGPVPLFLHDCKPMEPSALARDKKLAADLWAASSAAVGWEDQKK